MPLAKYKYPTKLKKFGIDDPFLNIVVAKYENEISWQTVVKDQGTLIKYIKETMLPGLMEQVKWPLEDNSKHFYVSHRHIDVNLAITTDQELDQEQVEIIKKTKEEKGINEATELLVDIINKRKKKSFDLWTKVLTVNYKSNPAYQILLLRSMFEQAGYGARRPVVAPDKDVIEWLFRRINNGRVNPNHNPAKEYFLKSAFKSTSVIKDGWTFVPKGAKNASKLAALSRGSGWCITYEEYARTYLNDFSFYILYSNASPVVALKVYDQNRVVLECQGRNNESPLEWFFDIHFFITTINLDLKDRLEDYYDIISDELVDDEQWWIQRKKLWYFSVEYAPDSFKDAISDFETEDLYKYIELISLPKLLKDYGIKFTTEDYIHLIKINPELYNKIPEEVLNDNQEIIKEACKSGWIEQVEDKELTRKELLKVQTFIKETNEFKLAITKSFPEDLMKILLRNPKTSSKKTTRFLLEKTLPITENEPIELSVYRVINIIINNQTSDFSDYIFPKEILEHDSFRTIREKGWEGAIVENPTFRLALPKDLEIKENFLFKNLKIKQDLLLKWTKNVEEKPWLLTQKNIVPKTIRYTQEILQAYVRGWIPYP